MKKLIMKVGLIIMALATMITMNACSKINKDTAKDVCNALSEKYGEEFVAVKIGDRFNKDSAKLYVYPVKNENILFTAKINRNTGAVEDNYIEEKVYCAVEDIFAESFAEHKITVASRCMAVTRNQLSVEDGEYTPKGFSDKYGIDHYTVYLAIKSGEYTAQDVISALKAVSEAIDVQIVTVAYVFDDAGYESCAKTIKEDPEISATMIEALSPMSSFDAIADNNGCSISENELAEKLGRS